MIYDSLHDFLYTGIGIALGVLLRIIYIYSRDRLMEISRIKVKVR